MPEIKLSTQNSETPAVQKSEKPAINRESASRKKAWLDEELMIEFYNQEEPGVPVVFSYGTTKNQQKFTLLHGGKYKLRREIVNHLESRQVPIWGYKPDGSGRLVKNIQGYKSRFQCRQVFDR